MTTALRAVGLSKRYRLGTSRAGDYRTLRETIADGLTTTARRLMSRRTGAARPGDFWALEDVSFEVEPGEVVGVIGRNGAGKSTLLKILSRITEPTAGRALIRGRVGSLLEVGTGFHPELTGRENIELNGSILGMSRREIARKFDAIVDFAELERFLDTPVKRYSSGMYVRLAFAVAAHLDLEILLVDEVLAVGDSEFQRKCIRKMGEVGRSGRTILLVSHNMAAVQNLCHRGILLSRGAIKADGDIDRVISAYHRQVAAHDGTDVDLRGHPGRTIGSIPCMTRARVGASGGGVVMGGTLRVEVDFESAGDLTGITFGVVLKNHLLAPVFGINNLVAPAPALDRTVRRGTATCEFPSVPLMPGTYTIDLYFGSRGQNFDVVHESCRFEVLPADVFGSGKLPPTLAGDVFCKADLGLIDAR